MGHTVLVLAKLFFWCTSILFACGMIGCVFVVLLTTIDDLKELGERREESAGNRLLTPVHTD
jgi:hypothetical protein